MKFRDLYAKAIHFLFFQSVCTSAEDRISSLFILQIVTSQLAIDFAISDIFLLHQFSDNEHL